MFAVSRFRFRPSPNSAIPRGRLFCLMALLLFLPSLSHAATTRKVPSQYPNMQAAINAAASGDTVLVANGTYTGNGNRDLDFGGKSLTFKSENGAASTIIDCQGTSAAPHRAFYIHQSEVTVVIEGLTIKNGYASGYGSGAYIASNSVTVTNCVFKDGYHGGIYISGGYNSTATVTNCALTNNDSSNNGTSGGGVYIFGGTNSTATNISSTFTKNLAFTGGGAYVSSATETVTNCTFTGNTSVYAGSLYNGGGLYIDGGTPTVTGCTFSNNTAYRGGGAYIASSNATVTNSAFNRNIASGESYAGNGGGIYIYSGASNSIETIAGCNFSGNTASSNGGSGYGGGAYINANASLSNCTFSSNTAGVNINGSNGLGCGGGAYFSTNSTLVNCSFSRNTASGNGGSYGGAIYTNSGQPTVTNCIAWNDSAATGDEIYFNISPTITAAARYCDIQGGTAAVYATNGYFDNTGDINVDPKFVNTTTGDLHLQTGSPCYGKGTHSGVPTTDKDGNLRPNPPSIGAYDLVVLLTVTLTPTAVYGGESSTGTVRLSSAAPTGGTAVTLSSNTGYAVVPTSVTVPAGSTSKTFTVTTFPVSATKAAAIAARAGSTSKTIGVIIYPPDLKTLVLSPTRVRGGYQNSTGTVTLTAAAPAGGAVVSLTSNTGYALVPGSVTVPAGSKTATFTVTTKPVTANKGVTITASKGSVSKVVGLILTP